MRFGDEFRDAAKARALSAKIASLCEPGRQYKFMEVCGGHTHTIYKHGLEDYLPESVRLVHGPGCPVCVIPMGRVDDAIAIAEQPDVIMTTFGDMMRVPGGRGSFFDSNAAGAGIRMVYSPLDGFIGPGHVSTVVGCRPYEYISRDYHKPLVCAGFEPLDILQSVYQLMLQVSEGRCEVENQYARVVPWNGNAKALRVIGEVM